MKDIHFYLILPKESGRKDRIKMDILHAIDIQKGGIVIIFYFYALGFGTRICC